MPVRSFNGDISGGDKIVAGGTGTAIFSSDFTALMLVYPFDLVSDKAFVGFQSGASHLIAGLVDGGVGFSGRLGVNTHNSFALGDVGLTANEWQWISMRRHAGGANPIRFSRRALLGGGWTHANSGATIADDDAICDRIEFGAFLNGGFGSPKHTLEATLAAYETFFSDEDLESIDGELSNQYLYDLGAIALVPLNQASTSTPVVDVVGDADQITITGTSVVTDNDPPGFDHAVTVIPPLEFSYDLVTGEIDDLDNNERGTGIIDYWLWKINNDDIDDAQVIVYISPQLESGRELAIGVAVEEAGDHPDIPEAGTTNAPADVVFATPTNPTSGLDMEVIPAGSFRYLWIRRTVNSGTPVDPTNSSYVRFEALRTS